jgi:hypothetical protein
MPVAAVGAALVFVVGVFALSRVLRRREREGDWDKEGHGTPEHQDAGVKYRPPEVPPSEPFN